MNSFIGPLNYSIISFKTNTCISLSKNNKEICKTLYRNGLISSYRIIKKDRVINVYCNYNYNNQAFTLIKQVSKSGRRIYISYHKIKKLWATKFDKSLLILSTNKGYLTSEEAIRLKIGGEFLCIIK